MGVDDIVSEPTKPESLNFYQYWYLQYCLTTGFNRCISHHTSYSFCPLLKHINMTSEQTVPAKIIVLLKAVGNTPILKQKNWTVDSSNNVAWLVASIKRILQLTPSDSLFLFINQAFSPSPDYTLGSLHQCYASGEKLIIHYSTTYAWG